MTIVCRAMVFLASMLIVTAASAQTGSVDDILTRLKAGGHVLGS